MLPDADDRPAGGPQPRVGIAVASYIPLKLRDSQPSVGLRFRCRKRDEKVGTVSSECSTECTDNSVEVVPKTCRDLGDLRGRGSTSQAGKMQLLQKSILAGSIPVELQRPLGIVSVCIHQEIFKCHDSYEPYLNGGSAATRARVGRCHTCRRD